MQKVYKLKQWYPGLPVKWKDGVIVIFNDNGYSIPCHEVETNPDFWELIQKTTWSLDEINEAIEKWKFTSKNEELLLVSELKSEFGL